MYLGNTGVVLINLYEYLKNKKISNIENEENIAEEIKTEK